MMPEVSILTAAFQNGRYIGQMIKSVLAQSFEDWELVIVDDGSTDDTKKIVEPYLADMRIQYVWQPNQGQAAARNTAYRRSSGKYIAILDSDDYWAATKLEKQVAIIDTNPDIGLIYTDSIKVDSNNNIIGKISGLPDISINPIEPLILGNNPIAFSSVMINRRFLNPKQLQEASILAADEAITLYRLAIQSGRFEYMAEPLLYYRVHSNSLTFTEDVELNKIGRLKALNLFFCEVQLPKFVTKLKRKAYARVYFSTAYKYNDRRTNPLKVLWNLPISFLYDPANIGPVVRQAIRTVYLHFIIHIVKKGQE